MFENISISSLKNRVPILDLKKQFDILVDDENPKSIRFLVIFTFIFSILYFIFPIDIIPDFFLGIGYLDDLSIYITLREIVYTGADSDIGVKRSIVETFRSKFIISTIILVFVILMIAILIYIKT